MNFSELNLHTTILSALRTQNYVTPTPIQEMAIPPVLAGRDVLGCAQTGTGKTAAFALPIIHRLITSSKPGRRRNIRVLALAPTRELAVQIGESFRDYSEHTHLYGTVVYGGVSQIPQTQALRRGVDILVATPGRLLDLMNQGEVDLQYVETLILDEADRMLDMGFLPDIRRLSKAIPTTRQTLLFSATMPPAILELASSMQTNPERITVASKTATVEAIEQSVFMVDRNDKTDLLIDLLQRNQIERALVFSRTKHGADKIVRKLGSVSINAEAIHGNKSQNKRQAALDSFKRGSARVLVATDIASRGLDINLVSHVFNFDLPDEPEAYVHRIGRTGRAGASGIAISFCSPDERGNLRSIERLINQRIQSVNLMSQSGIQGALNSPSHDRMPNRSNAPATDRKPTPQGGRTQSRDYTATRDRSRDQSAELGYKQAAKPGKPRPKTIQENTSKPEKSRERLSQSPGNKPFRSRQNRSTTQNPTSSRSK